MKRTKGKLLDTQRYSECQLVSIINAAIYLGEPPVDPSSEEYERLVDMVGARHGAAINTRGAVSYLRLVSHKIEPITMQNVRGKVLSGDPVSVGIWHEEVGLHSVLLTDSDEKTVRVWNAGIKEYKKGRVRWKRLRELMAADAAHNRQAEWYELDPLREGSPSVGQLR